MAKTKERLEARKLRKKGYSVKTISKMLSVARSSVSVWVRDIQLTPKQLYVLNQNVLLGQAKGHTTISIKYAHKRKSIFEENLKSGLEILKQLNSRELFIAGIALYWAEGTKKTRHFSLCNSDPRIISFAMNWFMHSFDLTIDRFRPYVCINILHKSRENAIIDYWSKITGIPRDQFTKTIIVKSKLKKIYENNHQYFGTLTLRITKSTHLYYQVIGLIEALSKIIKTSYNYSEKSRQRSSAVAAIVS
jgi:hypothetical protein